MNLSDTIVSIIRTVIPAAWGSLIAWLLSQIPALEMIESQIESIEAVVTFIVIGLWYSVTRALEPRTPEWLRKILFGVATNPEYDEKLGA